MEDIINENELSFLNNLFGEFKQDWFQNIFLYVTEKCQLNCGHCYLGNRLDRALTMPINQIYSNLVLLKKMGGKKLCILGGEPTLHPHFIESVEFAKSLAYEKIIIDTNGFYFSNKIFDLNPCDVSYIQVSLDGASPKTHEYIRGENTFQLTLNSIKKLCKKGFDVRVICTVNKVNITETFNVLDIADDLGITLVKFHICSQIGNSRKKDDFILSPKEWIEFTDKLKGLKGKYKTTIQYQPTYIRKADIGEYIDEGYDGCFGKKLNRASIFPDGKIYVCSYLFDTGLNFANIVNRKISVSKGINELGLFINEAEENMYCPVDKGFLSKYHSKEICSICRLWKSTI